MAKYEVTVVVGKRQTFVVEAADEAEARAKCEHGDKPSSKKYVQNKDEVVVVMEPKLAELGLVSRAARGFRKLLRRPGETDAQAYGRVYGDVAEGEQGDPEGPT
ncbi:MAG TPA: hypothetical protein VHM72_07685 [Solirubrobacteraceae bacterium]|nr:hypothetical protein [Solirubrobacteraceae bacterium]